MTWRNCKYAPFNKNSKHCLKENEGNTRALKNPSGHLRSSPGSHRANKGYYGCASRCRYFEPKV